MDRRCMPRQYVGSNDSAVGHCTTLVNLGFNLGCVIGNRQYGGFGTLVGDPDHGPMTHWTANLTCLLRTE